MAMQRGAMRALRDDANAEPLTTRCGERATNKRAAVGAPAYASLVTMFVLLANS
jgi:hypothetical protein